eukprot:Phypoly_transcript_12832.p1 GENE.Phypoly_transcript_12832~~Phypoly_transcript_12832.p1  ORF type:complete len:174 (+),score=10.16 Phypoly_transcript_12832:344-865(+)
MVRFGVEGSHLKRRKRQTAYQAIEGITVFEEIKLEKVPFSVACDPTSIQIYIFHKEIERELNLAKIVLDHGWQGGINFQQASETLKNVDADPLEKQIYMKYDDSLLAIDFKKGILSVLSSFKKGRKYYKLRKKKRKKENCDRIRRKRTELSRIPNVRTTVCSFKMEQTFRAWS